MLRQRALLTPCDLLQLNNSYSFTINVSSLPLPDVAELSPRPHQTGGEDIKSTNFSSATTRLGELPLPCQSSAATSVLYGLHPQRLDLGGSCNGSSPPLHTVNRLL